jgi:iron-sulfur cluster assembly accessory protein
MKLTEKAVVQIKQVMNEQNFDLDKTYIRVGILGQSCSGTVYSLSLDDSFDEIQDDLLNQDDVKIVNNKEITESLSPVVIDFKDEENKKGFIFINPLQVVTGGCGSGGCGSGTCSSKS